MPAYCNPICREKERVSGKDILNDCGEEEKLIHNGETYQEQIGKFYRNQLPSNREITVGNTPKMLQELGAKELPLVLKQSNLRKCIREPSGSRSAHQLSREIIEKVPELVEKPIIVVEEKQRNSLALLCDYKNSAGQNLLIAVKLSENLYGKKINEIKSIYGKEHLTEYLQKFDEREIHIINKEKAKLLSPTIGLQLPKAPIKLDYKETISQKPNYVKSENAKDGSAVQERSTIARDIRKSGFTPTKKLINAIQKMDRINGKANTMKDICNAYKGGCVYCGADEKKLINEIAQECKQQELAKMFMPER